MGLELPRRHDKDKFVHVVQVERNWKQGSGTKSSMLIRCIIMNDVIWNSYQLFFCQVVQKSHNNSKKLELNMKSFFDWSYDRIDGLMTMSERFNLLNENTS